MTTSTLDRPVKGPTFRPVALSRRIKNAIATSAFVAAFGIALIPLVWVL
jgi:phosphate transport system permease protein